MGNPQPDTRSDERKFQDEQIASEPPLAHPVLPSGAKPRPVEEHMTAHRRPVAVLGVVENGLVRPLDPEVKLTEHSRVIIVASESV